MVVVDSMMGGGRGQQFVRVPNNANLGLGAPVKCYRDAADAVGNIF